MVRLHRLLCWLGFHDWWSVPIELPSGAVLQRKQCFYCGKVTVRRIDRSNIKEVDS